MEWPISSVGRGFKRLPSWLVKKTGPWGAVRNLKRELRDLKLYTVCEEARCPNTGECWSRRTATLMVLGGTCTRRCGFCAVTAGRPLPPDPEEPAHVAEMVAGLGLQYVVITMVTRDDLPDGGAVHLGRVIVATRRRNPGTRIEVLTSDFQGDKRALETVLSASPDIFNHNIETVERLSPLVRPRAGYRRSLWVLKAAAEISDRPTKSGLMLGLGEKPDEVLRTLRDLREAGCELLTIGQYLRPTLKNLPVVEYPRPEVFEEWEKVAEGLGFVKVASGPFVRSSYHAEEMGI